MKLNAINNINSKQNIKNNINNNAKNSKNVNFTGAGEALVGFWKFIDSSRGIQFTFEDMIGTNIPRTWKGARAGYKYTGKINKAALAQEFIREFLTGPTMTFAPVGILAAIVGLSGKPARTHRENMDNLSYIAQQHLAKNTTPENFKQDFITEVVKDTLKQTTKEEVHQEDVATLVDGIMEFSKKTNSAKTRKEKKAAKGYMEELQKTFEGIVKARKQDYKDTNFQLAKYTIGKNAQGETKTGAKHFTDYVEFMTSYVQDYAKKHQKNNTIDLSDDTIKSFKRNWFGKRALTLASMILLTGTLMSFIPKIYTFFSGKENPNGQGVYAEAQKRGGNK